MGTSIFFYETGIHRHRFAERNSKCDSNRLDISAHQCTQTWTKASRKYKRTWMARETWDKTHIQYTLGFSLRHHPVANFPRASHDLRHLWAVALPQERWESTLSPHPTPPHLCPAVRLHREPPPPGAHQQFQRFWPLRLRWGRLVIPAPEEGPPRTSGPHPPTPKSCHSFCCKGKDNNKKNPSEFLMSITGDL